MRNRYGDEYWFEKTSENEYILRGELKHDRLGGQEGQQEIDESCLGFIDFSGGPFISVGSKIFYDEIQGSQKGAKPLTVKRIRNANGTTTIEVEE